MSRRTQLCLFSLISIVGIAWFGRTIWLEAAGNYLTGARSEDSVQWDFAVIPAADYVKPGVNVETLKEAAHLMHTGRVKYIMMSCSDVYDISGCELAEIAVQDRGYSKARIEQLRTDLLSDELEATKVVRWLTEHAAKSATILLPNYKARRLGGVYHRLGVQSGIGVHLSLQNQEFDPHKWWRSREGQKRFAEELARLTRLL